MAAKPLSVRAIDDFVREVKTEIFDLKDKVIIVAHGRLVAASPVDLGQARAGWNFSVNKIDFETPAKPSSGSKLPPPAPPDPKSKRLSDVYHISNFVEHIIYNNEGNSEQAPKNFVEREIAATIKDVGL